jgi:uncharacterized protein Yka (UPF0111/DUF47 family)
MNIDSILKFFVPKDNSFYPLFDEVAAILVKTAEQLELLVFSVGTKEQESVSGRIKELGYAGNAVALKTYVQLNTSFITPFEREGIHDLACNIDDLLNSMTHISKSISFYQPVKLDKLYCDLAAFIFQSTQMINQCLNDLKEASANKRSIISSCNDLKTLVCKAKETFYTGIADLLAKEKDMTELIKNKEILENFEKCLNRTGAVSSTLKSMLLRIL